jgi:hypothetical protein
MATKISQRIRVRYFVHALHVNQWLSGFYLSYTPRPLPNLPSYKTNKNSRKITQSFPRSQTKH